MNLFSKYLWICKAIGWDNVPRRLWYYAELKSGYLRYKTAPTRYSELEFAKQTSLEEKDVLERWKQRAGRFFQGPDQATLRRMVDPGVWKREVAAVCERAVEGRYPFFSHWSGGLGWPPNFNFDPVHNIDWPVGEHWSKTTKSGPPRNDIKLVWEASRFSLAYYLARQYRYSGEEVWAVRFWEMFDAWVKQNPVNETVAWGCGQEVAFRIMAMLTAAFAMIHSPATTTGRLEQLELLCWQSALRIDANKNFAISQKNNHSLSEATGLWTIGLLFPEFKESSQWLGVAETIFEREVPRQIYADGSFVQHSVYYHRVMLDDLMWAIQLGRINGRELSESIVINFQLAIDWLYELVDAENGRAPNVGTNDGANVLPLAACGYLDFRPTIQAAQAVASSRRVFASGVWDEKSAWLDVELQDAPPHRERTSSWRAPDGGYYILRHERGKLLMRCAQYRDRPAQEDNLHVDVWHRGRNMVCDAGSYMYYHRDAELAQYFKSVQAHNTAEFSDSAQMRKGPSFLWLEWPDVSVEKFSERSVCCTLQTKVGAPVRHQRSVERIGESFRIEDNFECDQTVTVRWRLGPELEWERIGEASWQANVGDGEKYEIKIEVGDEITVGETVGLLSLYYGEKTDCRVIEVIGRIKQMRTILGPAHQDSK